MLAEIKRAERRIQNLIKHLRLNPNKHSKVRSLVISPTWYHFHIKKRRNIQEGVLILIEKAY